MRSTSTRVTLERIEALRKALVLVSVQNYGPNARIGQLAWNLSVDLQHDLDAGIFPTDSPAPPAEQCAQCARSGMGPSHNPSPWCKSGSRPHCSCDTCF